MKERRKNNVEFKVEDKRIVLDDPSPVIKSGSHELSNDTNGPSPRLDGSLSDFWLKKIKKKKGGCEEDDCQSSNFTGNDSTFLC